MIYRVSEKILRLCQVPQVPQVPSPGYPADDILVAILGFPRHRCVALWCDVLATKISESSLALLPALLLRLEGSEAGSSAQQGGKRCEHHREKW